MSQEINKCLHCGHEAKLQSDEVSGGGYDDGYYLYYIKCTHCNISTGRYTDSDTPYVIWNSVYKEE